MKLVYWHSQKTRHDDVIRHYGFKFFAFRICFWSKPVHTNIQDAASRPLLVSGDEQRIIDCKHPDCGRFYDHNAKSMSCRAFSDNACARPDRKEVT